MTADRTGLEAEIRAAWQEQNYNLAITVLLRGYGPELLGFLVARLRDESAASEVFSLFCMDLLRGLPTFGWRSTARVWAYTVARHAANRWAAAPHRRAERNVPLSQAGELGALADQVRKSTLPHLRSEVKNRFALLREQLSQQDQTILILRVDKKLAWRDLAAVMLYDGEPVDDEQALERETIRLRKRFQLIKDQLRKLAEAEGMLTRGDPAEGAS